MCNPLMSFPISLRVQYCPTPHSRQRSSFYHRLAVQIVFNMLHRFFEAAMSALEANPGTTIPISRSSDDCTATE